MINIRKEDTEVYENWKIFYKKLLPSDIKYKMFTFNDYESHILQNILKIVLGVRCKDINKPIDNNMKCGRCGEFVYLPSNIKTEGAVLCNRCSKSSDLSLYIVDNKTGKLFTGHINITNLKTYRIFGVAPFFDKYLPHNGDIVKFYFNSEDSKIILAEFMKNGEAPKATMAVKCTVCETIYRLSQEELDYVGTLALNNNVRCSDILNYMNIKKGNTCNENKNHSFEFDPIFYNGLLNLIRNYDNAIAKRTRYLKELEELEIVILKSDDMLNNLTRISAKFWKRMI